MKIFKIKDNVEVVCESEKTRSGFRHVAVLHMDGNEVARAKVCYLNRTWESFEFETVLRKLLENSALSAEEKSVFFRASQRKNKEEGDAMFGTVANIAKLGDVFGNTTKEKNDWKQRMLKAGLPDLQIPEDWNALGEDEKERRINMVIEMLTGESSTKR